LAKAGNVHVLSPVDWVLPLLVVHAALPFLNGFTALGPDDQRAGTFCELHIYDALIHNTHQSLGWSRHGNELRLE
jgi:hypothetical protein